MLGSGCMGTVIFFVPHSGSFPVIFCLYMLIGLGEAVIWPVLGAFATEEGRDHFGHGTMMGVFNLAMSGGVFCGAMLAGISMDTLGMVWAYYISGIAVLGCTSFGAYLLASARN